MLWSREEFKEQNTKLGKPCSSEIYLDLHSCVSDHLPMNNPRGHQDNWQQFNLVSEPSCVDNYHQVP